MATIVQDQITIDCLSIEDRGSSKIAEIEIRLADDEPKRTTVYSHHPELLLTSLKRAIENATQTADFAAETDSCATTEWVADKLYESLWYVEHGQRNVHQALEDLQMSLRKDPEEFLTRTLFIYRNRRVIPSWLRPNDGRGKLSEEENLLDALDRLQRVRDRLDEKLCEVASHVAEDDWLAALFEALAEFGETQDAFGLTHWNSRARV